MAVPADVLMDYAEPDLLTIDTDLHKELNKFDRKIIVLDDDPTGTQTVHHVSVFTDWSLDTIREGFLDKNRMFYILTNSRGMTTEETVRIHKEIAERVVTISTELNCPYIIVSRSDSTLRGHFPLETETLYRYFEKNDLRMDGEILIPFFLAGGRFTLNNIHYVREVEQLIPVGHTEFARDKSFGFQSSHMGDWCEEKSNGAIRADDVSFITMEDLRTRDYEGICSKLRKLENFNKIVVNAIADADIKVFATALLRSLGEGKNFIFRTAAGFPQVIGGVPEQDLLGRNELSSPANSNGGIILIGSHVNKTTQQLNTLLNSGLKINGIEFNQHKVLEEGGLKREVTKVLDLTEDFLRNGKNVVIYTRRERFDLETGNKDAQLAVSVQISGAVTSIIGGLKVRPRFIIAKGGITSSDVATKALKIRKALVLGQILPGVPVWKTGPESKFPGLPYIIFPGNVGSEDALNVVVETLDS